MGNVSLKVLEKSLNFLFKNGYEPCFLDCNTSKERSSLSLELFPWKGFLSSCDTQVTDPEPDRPKGVHSKSFLIQTHNSKIKTIVMNLEQKVKNNVSSLTCRYDQNYFLLYLNFNIK